jgi:26S proteasome regulatory subunit N2
MFNCSFSLSAKALDEYASIKTRASKATEEEEENIDPRLEAIVERMLEKYEDNNYSIDL